MKLKEWKQYEELQEKSKLSLTRRSTSPEKSKPPPEKPPESQIKHKLQGFKKNHEKNQRTISYLQQFPSPEYLLSPEKSPEIAGRTEMEGET